MANFGYLVANTLKDDAATELRILSSLHGIGFILLNSENPTESEIRIPARERTNLDWDAMDRVAKENKDFLNYIKTVKNFHKTKDIDTHYWDINTKED